MRKDTYHISFLRTLVTLGLTDFLVLGSQRILGTLQVNRWDDSRLVKQRVKSKMHFETRYRTANIGPIARSATTMMGTWKITWIDYTPSANQTDECCTVQCSACECDSFSIEIVILGMIKDEGQRKKGLSSGHWWKRGVISIQIIFQETRQTSALQYSAVHVIV